MHLDARALRQLPGHFHFSSLHPAFTVYEPKCAYFLLHRFNSPRKVDNVIIEVRSEWTVSSNISSLFLELLELCGF